MTTTSTSHVALATGADALVIDNFTRNLDALRELFGASEFKILPEGQTLKTYTTAGTLQDGSFTEGNQISASTYENTAASKTLTFKMWRKPTYATDIVKEGYEAAVIRTDECLVSDITSVIAGDIIDGLETGTGTATGTDFQKTLAAAWAAVNKAFKNVAHNNVYFANSTTAAEWLGSASVINSTEFGLQVIENFMGKGKLIINEDVADDYIYATAEQNLVIAACKFDSIPELGMVTDETGVIAVGHSGKQDYASVETCIYTGLCIFPKYADRVIKAEVDPS